MANMNLKDALERSLLATKKYVDDTIQENRPCYDERVLETFNSAEDFNGDITGKVVIEEVSSASTEEITAKGSFIPKYVKMGDVAPVFNNLASNIENGNVKATCTVRYEHADLTEVDTSELHMLDENCVVLMDSTWSNRVFFVYNEITSPTGAVLPPGIWYVYLDNGKGTVIYPISYSIEILDGDFKKLSYKYIDYMPGKNVTGEAFIVYDNINDFHMEENGIYSIAQTGAEIFNDKTNVATGEYSHAEGAGTAAYGDYSHAEGLGSVTFEAYSHAEGYHTVSNGPGTHAEGRGTISEGMWSHAENYGAYAKGWGSHAEGNSTIASGEAQHVQGRFNIEDTENKYAHIVGNGEYAKKRSNAHTLDWSGNAWFKGNVFVNGTSQVDAQKLATEEFVTNQITSLVDSAPDAMNTLNELANSIINHATEYEAYVATVSNALAGKAPASHGTHLELGTGSGNAFRGDYGNTAYNHSQAAHAPSNAQKNSDITKAEIEAKLTGNITSHTHSAYAAASHGTHLELGTGSGNAFRGDYGNTAYNHSQAAHAPSNAQKNSDITKAEIEAKLTGTITSHNHSGTYAPATHGNHVPTAQTAQNNVFLRNDNTWQKITPENIGAAPASHGTHVTYGGNGSASTVSRSDHTHSYLPLSGGTMTGNIKFTDVTSTTYPAKSAMLTWNGSTDGADIYYQVDASDKGRLVLNTRDDADCVIAFANSGTIVSTIDNSGNFSGKAATATKATQDSAGQQINTTYIKGLSVSGKTITYTKGDGTTGTITTQDTNTTYSTGTASALGLTKLYTGTGTATDGTMTQSAIKSALDGKSNTSHTHNYAGSSSAGGAANSANILNVDNRMTYNWNGLNYFNISGTAGNAAKVNDTPTTAWWHIIRCNHANAAGYYTDIAVPFNDTSMYYKRITSGAVQNNGWVKILDSLNWSNYAAAKSHGTHLSLGTTSSTAYRGDYGNTAYNHSQSAHAPTNAQKNSDITKAEIEAKLTGAITSHSHASVNGYTVWVGTQAQYDAISSKSSTTIYYIKS